MNIRLFQVFQYYKYCCNKHPSKYIPFYVCQCICRWNSQNCNGRVWIWTFYVLILVVQSPSHGRLFGIPWTAACQAALSLTIFWSFPKFIFIASVIPLSHPILLCPLLFLPLIFPSIKDFSNELAVCIRWPKYWSFSISPSNECSGLISFKIGWFDLLAIQGTLRCLLQHHSSKASILWRSAFFMVQLSQLFVTTGKTIALTMLTFVSGVMSAFQHTV